MGKITRGKNGKLYNGKGTKGGLAPTPPAKGNPISKLPKLPVVPISTISKGIEPTIDYFPAQEGETPPARKLPNISDIDVPENLIDTIDGIDSEADSIEFPNHNSDAKTDWLTLRELISEDKHYLNNCDAVSGEVYNYLEEMQDEYEGISNVDLVQLDYAKGAHVAVSVTNEDGKDWVIDYTAKQFDTSLPVPLVLPKKTWEDLIDGYIWAKHKDSRI